MTTTAHEAVASEKRSVDHHDGPIRVFLVADVCVYRELLVDALASEGRIEVAGSTPADVAGMAIRMAEPDVVLVDTSSGSGPQRVWALAAGAPAAKIVAVGIPDDESVVLGLMEAGIAGYITAEQPLGELVEAVEAAANGELKCSPRVSAVLARRVAAQKAEELRGSDAHRLTQREREIAALIAEGLSNKQIARRLSIERATAKNHVHNILAKLRVDHRGEVATLFRASLLTLLTAVAAANVGVTWSRRAESGVDPSWTPLVHCLPQPRPSRIALPQGLGPAPTSEGGIPWCGI
jgi:two-component system, NarL family, nitrate/nitrite response regulator NarL